MSPKTNDFDGLDRGKHLIDQAVLNVDPPRASTRQISDQLLVRGRILIRIGSQDFEKSFSFRPQAGGGEFLRVLLRLGEDEPPAHQASFFDSFLTGVLRPALMDSRIPGIESRWRVSWMARQSSSEIRTALERFPVIWTGSCEEAA